MLKREKKPWSFRPSRKNRGKIRERADCHWQRSLPMRRVWLLKRHPVALFTCGGFRGLGSFALASFATVLFRAREHEKLRTRHTTAPQQRRHQECREQRIRDGPYHHLHYRAPGAWRNRHGWTVSQRSIHKECCGGARARVRASRRCYCRVSRVSAVSSTASSTRSR